MIAPNVVKEVRRLLAEGKLSQRAIAKATRVSRGTVGAIASGSRPDYDRLQRPRADEDSLRPEGPLRRCPGCGGMVYLPCRACRVQETRDRRPGRFLSRWAALLEEPLGFDFRDEHRVRYEEVHARKMAAERSIAFAPNLPEPLETEDEDFDLTPDDLRNAFDPEDLGPGDDELDALQYDAMLPLETAGDRIE